MKFTYAKLLLLVFAALLAAGSSAPSLSRPVRFYDPNYGLSFDLPASWDGYTVLRETWDRQTDSRVGSPVEHGPIIIFRHPRWSAARKLQDIPIYVFTLKQWEAGYGSVMSAGGYDIIISKNLEYVFALNNRFNFGAQESDDPMVAESAKEAEMIVGRQSHAQ